MAERLGIVPTAAELLDAPARALELGPAEAVALLARVEGLAAVLRLAAMVPPRNGERPDAPEPELGRNGEPPTQDGLLSIEAAARLAGVTREQFLRREAFRPAVVKLGHRTRRVDQKRLRRILTGMGD